MRFNSQRDFLLHEMHDFSQPFDGWFNWRFISKKDEPDQPPQKGFFTPGFNESLPIHDHAHVTKSLLQKIGDALEDTYGVETKIDSALKEEYGDDWNLIDSVLPIDSGITYWEQFDCDC